MRDEPTVGGGVLPASATRSGLDQIHAGGLAEDSLVEVLPLCLRDLDVDWRGDVHPGVDRACDGKKAGGASAYRRAQCGVTLDGSSDVELS